MQRLLKLIGYLIGVLVMMAVGAAAYVYLITDTRLNKVHEIPLEEIPIPSDAESIARGRRLVVTVGFCSDCHGMDLGGNYFDEGPLVGGLAVANLTSGKGGIANEFTSADWVRAIRHGVKKDGRTLIDMPSQAYNQFSDEDLGAIIAFIRTLPPVDRVQPKSYFGPMVRLYFLFSPELLPAEQIDHQAPRPPAPKPGPTAEYGQYLSIACKVCHEPDLAGSSEPGGGLNLTPGGELQNWTEADFIRAMRTGTTPSGHYLDPAMMPWHRIGLLNDMELQAIWRYLQSLPPVENLPVQATPVRPTPTRFAPGGGDAG